MTSELIQSTFQFGETSPLLLARVDSPIYFRSARRLRNVVTIPQGGVKVRFGTTYVAAVGGGITNYAQIKPLIMDYEDGSRYLMIFRNLALDIYHNDALVQTIVTTYTTAEVPNISWAQSPNLLFICHGSHMPAILRRTTAAHNSWSLNATPTFTNYPTYDFDQNYDAINFSITIGGVAMTTAQNITGQAVVLNASAAVFTANHVGGLYFGASGTLRITGFTSTTQVTARIVNIFDSASSLFTAPNTIPGSDSVLTEIAFSATRGYPQKAAFFQSRVFFARTSSLPGGLFGSSYNGFTISSFNFDDSDALDTNAVSTVIYGRRAAVIQHLVGYKSLLVFTSDGLFSSPLLEDLPITPQNIAYINLQTADASGSVEPQVLDNQVIFFDKGGKKAKDVNLIARTGTFNTNNISVLSPHLIDQPNSSGVYENSETEDGTWLMLTNEGDTLDGTLSIYQSVPEQQITAWTNSSTDGKFRWVVADESLVYLIVERTINSATVLYIEKLNWNVRTDCASVQTLGAPGTTITGLSHLNGKEVRVIGDGAVMQSRTVSGGQITVEYAITDVEVGLNYDPTVIPMPVTAVTPNGTNVYAPKTIKGVYVDYNESLGIILNGTAIPSLSMAEDNLNEPPIPKTGFYKVNPFGGWEPRVEMTITQNDPLPFTLIGVGFEVEH